MAGQIAHFLTRSAPWPSPATAGFLFDLAWCGLPLLAVNTYQYVRRDLLAPVKFRLPLRIAVYAGMLTALLVLGVRDSIEFVYFQF